MKSHSTKPDPERARELAYWLERTSGNVPLQHADMLRALADEVERTQVVVEAAREYCRVSDEDERIGAFEKMRDALTRYGVEDGDS